jgi:GT2 family glycosyltransferase
LNIDYLDAFGGPDAAHESFTDTQKAISYSMTSLFTTGGIRGNKKHIGQFHPRSFNMGISRDVFEKTKGYILPKKGEDIEFSIRIIENGFKTGLIEEAFVYHKRRTDLKQFYKQLHFFGTARINIFRFYREELKLVHFFPFAFMLFSCSIPVIFLLNVYFGILFLSVLKIFLLLNIVDSSIKNMSLKVGLLSGLSSFIQLFAYGVGFAKEGLIYIKEG